MSLAGIVLADLSTLEARQAETWRRLRDLFETIATSTTAGITFAARRGRAVSGLDERTRLEAFHNAMTGVAADLKLIAHQIARLLAEMDDRQRERRYGEVPPLVAGFTAKLDVLQEDIGDIDLKRAFPHSTERSHAQQLFRDFVALLDERALIGLPELSKAVLQGATEDVRSWTGQMMGHAAAVEGCAAVIGGYIERRWPPSGEFTRPDGSIWSRSALNDARHGP